MCAGFCRVDVPASPKFQAQEVGVLVDLSVNETLPEQVVVGVAVNCATGACEKAKEKRKKKKEKSENENLFIVKKFRKDKKDGR